MEHSRSLLYTLALPVRWGDMDALGHVNNTVYFRYMEQARVEWLETNGLFIEGRQQEGSAVIVNAGCTFLIPITYPATIEVSMFAGPPGRSSIATFYEIRCRGDHRLFAEGTAKIVWIDPATGRSSPLPERLRASLAAVG